MVRRNVAATGRRVVGRSDERGLVRGAWSARDLVRADERGLVTAYDDDARGAR